MEDLALYVVIPACRESFFEERFWTSQNDGLMGGEFMENIVVFITASGEDEAANIAKALVEGKLAACVNIVRNLRSIYSWQGKVEDESEVLMIVKTQKKLFHSLSQKVRELHSYSVPEIIALPIVEGSEDYLKWLKEVTD